MIICDGCERCMHLRCLIPPQTVAPSGQFYCPACDLGFSASISELIDLHTPLQYNSPRNFTPIRCCWNICVLTGQNLHSQLVAVNDEQFWIKQLRQDFTVNPTTGCWYTKRCAIKASPGCVVHQCSIAGTSLDFFMRLLVMLRLSKHK